MEHIEDQLNARKMRLKQLSRPSEVNTESHVAANNIGNSIHNIQSDQSPEKSNNEIIDNTEKKIQPQKKSQDSLKRSLYPGTTMMRDTLQESLDELNIRTEEAIKRVVRRRLISDAIHDE